MRTHAHATPECTLDKLFYLDNSNCLVKEFEKLLGESHDESDFEEFEIVILFVNCVHTGGLLYQCTVCFQNKYFFTAACLQQHLSLTILGLS